MTNQNEDMANYLRIIQNLFLVPVKLLKPEHAMFFEVGNTIGEWVVASIDYNDGEMMLIKARKL